MKAKILTILLLLTTGWLSAQNLKKEVVYFDYDKSELTSKSVDQLDQLATEIRHHDIVRITITGHTDSDGSNRYNDGLSRRRADEVKLFLAAKGIDTSKVSLMFYGEQKPVASNEIPTEKYRNRRVEIIVEYQTQNPEELTPKYRFIEVVSNRDTSIVLNKKGTTLHIPSDAFEYEDGSPVYGRVNLRYKEYRNSADMAFSQIPMFYYSNGMQYAFNSSGMFELYGMYKDQPVKIARGKTLKIDYALAKQNPDIAFYRLNDDRKNWNRIQEIEKLANEDFPIVMEGIKPMFAHSTKAQRRWLIHIGKFKMFRLKDKTIAPGERIVGWERKEIEVSNKQTGSLLASGMNAGHTYPDIVRGLNVGSFGVYNCDQAYRIPNQVAIRPNFTDEKGNPINNGHVLSMMDLNYNGAFSYDPVNFSCDAKGKIALALFTNDGELFIMSPDEFSKMNITSGGEYTFTMKNMTDRITSSDDLADYLGIKL
ncbi:MAG: OmpA family protein [Bacteroidetes bacterium]|nr:OmpA family protein [Bacteroidota bacterium]